VAASSEPDRWQNRNPNSMGLGQDSCSAAHFRTINTILVLQTPALILINLSSLAGLAASFCSSAALWLNGNAHPRIVYLLAGWVDGVWS